MRAKGFCILDVFYEGLSRTIMQLLIKKDKQICQLFLFLQVLLIKTLVPDADPDPLEMLNSDPDPDSRNPDPQFWC